MTTKYKFLSPKQREVIVNTTIKNYAIAEGSKIGRFTYNHNNLFDHVSTAREKERLNKLLLENLKTVVRDWSYVLVALHDDKDEIYYHLETGIITNCVSMDANDFISPAMRDFIDEVYDDNICSWMWLVAPNTDTDWNLSIESLIDANIHSGLLGEENKHLAELAIKYRKPLEEREICLLN